MILATASEALPSAAAKPGGAIIRITADGKIDPKPIVRGLLGLAGLTT